ncbi:uncharacterized protein LOC114267493 isoform X4 [Camellia sinensis]|uniref:uncharacterized protein LOC114267493 isoform X4 n=1 Tax=Camellia sinensis TaxID=4442 RepID=UPI001036B275|nr:uncharacterized protein LOC114267493 isoform X4 [Camellia sinensis]XP_028064328.1 uncharacterized protein LOC114267493 isoform X4 [Camellia sinensis]
MEMTEDNDIQTIQMKAELDRGEVILQKQDICLSDVEDKRVAGLNDFSSLKECKCCLGGGGFCDLWYVASFPKMGLDALLGI